MSLLNSTGPRHEAMVKEALIGSAVGGLARIMGRAGKVIIKNPMKSIGAGFAAGDMVSGTQRMSEATAGGRNMAAGIGAGTM
jgi:hypothetical protein